MKVVVLLSQIQIDLVQLWLLVNEVDDGLFGVAILEHRLHESGEVSQQLGVLARLQTSLDGVEERVTTSHRLLTNYLLHGIVCHLLPFVLLLVRSHAVLEVILRLAVQHGQLLFVERPKHVLSEQSQLVARMLS